MPLTTCPSCQREVQQDRQDCPYCGVVFAKWKGRTAHRETTPTPPDNTKIEQIQQTLSDAAILHKDICVESFEYSWNEKTAQAYCAQLNAWQISHRIKEPDRGEDWTLSWDVYVPVRHLFQAKVLNRLFHKGLTLPELCNQTTGFKKKVLTNALAFVADKTGPFKRSLFSDESLAWYQRYSGLSDKDMQSAFIKAPQVFQVRVALKSISFFSLGVAGIILSWKDLLKTEVEGAWALFAFAVVLVWIGFKKAVHLARSERKWA